MVCSFLSKQPVHLPVELDAPDPHALVRWKSVGMLMGRATPYRQVEEREFQNEVQFYFPTVPPSHSSSAFVQSRSASVVHI